MELLKTKVHAHLPPRGGRRHRRLRRAVPARHQEVQAARCSPRRPTAWAPSWSSPSRWTCTTRSASTWSRWSSTTWSPAAPSRCSCSTTSPAARSCRRRSPRSRAGIADGCRTAGCALLGGETAEHPGVLRPHEYDSAGDRRRRGRGGRDPRPRTGSRSATWSSRCARPACTPTATRWCGTCCCGIGRMRLDTVHRGVRQPAHARPGAAHPDPDLRQGLPRSDRRGRGPRAGPHHRRRHPRQPGPGAAGARRRGRRPGHLAAAADLRSGPAQGPHRPVRNGVHVQHGRRHDGDRLRRATPTGRWPSCAAAGIDAWVVGEVIDGTGEVQMVGSHTSG